MDSKTATNKKRRSSKSTEKKSSSFASKILNFFGSLIILILFFMVIAFVGANVVLSSVKNNTVEITENNFWQSQSKSTIYDANGDEIGKLTLRDVDWTPVCGELDDDESRNDVPTLEMCDKGQKAMISPYYVNALIATEDQNFMDHGGVDYKGLVRVTLSALVNKNTSAGGASTITMQLAKLLYLGDAQVKDIEDEPVSWARGEYMFDSYNMGIFNPIKYKLSQMALASKIEDIYSKQQIMENYVNTMWFGSGGYGIKNAADYYYGVDPSELTIDQAATLAGMTQRPNDWNPYTNPEDTTTRRNTVINRMQSQGYITEKEAKEAKEVDIQSNLASHDQDEEEYATRMKYYSDVNDYVLEEVYDLLGTDVDLSTGGMKIYTTIDPQLQKDTIDILDTDNNLIGYPIIDGTQTGTAMIDVETGGILAFGNGFDDSSPYAYAWNENRQPGSTAKPITAYSAAIEYLDWSTAHELNDVTTYYSPPNNNIEVKNYSGDHQGKLTMMSALAQSLNTTAVETFKELEDEIGKDGIKEWMINVGIRKVFDADEHVYESYALGSFGTTPIEMASAFATFANGGTYNEPHVIDHIVFDEQSPYYDIYGGEWYPEYESYQAMKPSTAYLITMMLNPDIDGAFTSEADIEALDLAIKTGTTNWDNTASQYGIPIGYARDRWTVGYSPDVATAVWYGFQYEYEQQGYYFDEQPSQPLYIFKALMEQTVDPDNENLVDGEFKEPDNVVEKEINGQTHYFIKGSDEDESIDANSSTGNETLSSPSYSYTISSSSVGLTWSKTSGADSYNIIVNGKEVANTTKTSYNLSYEEIMSVGCEPSYQIAIQSANDSGAVSGTYPSTISIDTSTCRESSTDDDSDDE